MNKATAKYSDWNAIPWKRVEKEVSKLQKRIYRAKAEGNQSLVKKLQKLLMNSQFAKWLATRKVTQDNRVKKTAGVDGVKSLPPKARMELAGNLKINGKCKPLRRIYIPKSDGTERNAHYPSQPYTTEHCKHWSSED